MQEKAHASMVMPLTRKNDLEIFQDLGGRILTTHAELYHGFERSTTIRSQKTKRAVAHRGATAQGAVSTSEMASQCARSCTPQEVYDLRSLLDFAFVVHIRVASSRSSIPSGYLPLVLVTFPQINNEVLVRAILAINRRLLTLHKTHHRYT